MTANTDSNQRHPNNVVRLAVSAACAGVPVAQAQTVLEEIIVTATKREASMQDVALAITAFSDQDIVRQGFKNFADYVGQIPSLSLTERQPGATSVIMRGCAAQGLTFSDSATTSVYLDEQPITAAGYNPDPRLIDIARVEALSGPQGTLFGDAAQCGTLRIITNKPDASEFDGWIDATGMTVDDGGSGYDVSVMLNMPIVQDKLALRLVGFVADEPGYIDNVLSPSPGSDPALGVDPANNFDNSAFVGEDVNSASYSGGRVGLRWNAAETWTVDLAGIYQKYELDGFGDVDLNQQQFADTNTFPTLGELDQIRFSRDDWEDEWYQLALTIEGSLGFADLVVTGAYFERESFYNADATTYLQAFQQTNTYMNIYSAYCIPPVNYYGCNIYDFNGDPLANDFDGREIENVTFEARLSSPADSDSRWSWIAGAFYNKRDLTELFTSNISRMWDAATWDFYNGTGDTPGGYYLNYSAYNYNAGSSSRSDNWFTGTYNSELEQYALFGEITVDVTDNFSITAGGRWYEIENDYVVVQAALVGLTGGIPDCNTHYCYTGPNDLGMAKDNGFVPKVTLAYSWGDSMVYGTYSEGFRRGGVNSARPQSIYGNVPGFGGDPNAGRNSQYEPDEVTNYEIGAKTEWLDNALRFNISAYHMVWDGIQVQAEDTVTGTFSLGIINLAEATIDGVDAWLAWAPSDSLQIEATIGYNDAQISESFTIPDTTTTIPDGRQLPLVPDWKASLNLTYTFNGELFSGTPYILANYRYQGDSTNSLGIESSSFVYPVREQPSWSIVDLRFGIDGDSWSASVFVDNALDERAELFYNNRWAQQRLSVNQPRTYGINFRKNFGSQ